ncbi:hypothetical protein C0J52_01746 [Blattella germanica]|nr:hypothetical protein C0J52_01746 [Blattella germanica]
MYDIYTLWRDNPRGTIAHQLAVSLKIHKSSDLKNHPTSEGKMYGQHLQMMMLLEGEREFAVGLPQYFQMKMQHNQTPVKEEYSCYRQMMLTLDFQNGMLLHLL